MCGQFVDMFLVPLSNIDTMDTKKRPKYAAGIMTVLNNKILEFLGILDNAFQVSFHTVTDQLKLSTKDMSFLEIDLPIGSRFRAH